MVSTKKPGRKKSRFDLVLDLEIALRRVIEAGKLLSTTRRALLRRLAEGENKRA